MRPNRVAARAAAICLVLVIGTAQAAQARVAPPETYMVSTQVGALPEGIAIGAGGRMFVGSDGTGAIYGGSVRESTLRTWASPASTGRSTTLGIKLDRAGRVYSVGADTVTVHDRSGRLVSSARVPTGPVGAARLNDLAVTKDWVYVTDFANPLVYRLPRQGNGRIGPAEAWLDMRTVLPEFPARYWFLNGIVASPDARTLLVASNGTETTWRVDIVSGRVSALRIDVGSFGPDGLAVRGSTLYAVINHGAPDGVYVATLDDTWESATLRTVISQTGQGTPFDTPTTLAVYDCRIYVVNSQNRHRPGVPPYVVSTNADPTCRA